MNKNSFQNSIFKGLLSKTYFQDSDITIDFLSWLEQFIIDDGRNLKEIGLDYKFKYQNFQTAINNYRWPSKGKGLSFEETFNKFHKWRVSLRSIDNYILLNTCKEILKWGGILNDSRVEEIGDLRFFLNHMEKKLSQQEIFIYDLNNDYINSGFTKIYAALNPNFIMYDGRVGASLCYFIRKFLEEKGKSEIPSELIFGWGLGRGKQNRNPSTENYYFFEITSNRNIHFISNIKANWMIESIAKSKLIFPEIKEHNKRVFALQTAFFVLGEDLPIINRI